MRSYNASLYRQAWLDSTWGWEQGLGALKFCQKCGSLFDEMATEPKPRKWDKNTGERLYEAELILRCPQGHKRQTLKVRASEHGDWLPA